MAVRALYHLLVLAPDVASQVVLQVASQVDAQGYHHVKVLQVVLQVDAQVVLVLA